MNHLYYGDCLNVLSNLESDIVDLVYLDPPFNSQENYNAFFSTADRKISTAQVLAFEDTWHWGQQSELEYLSLLKNPNAGLLAENMLPSLRGFLGESDMMAYLVMMASRLVEIKRVLKPTGSLYLHCDPKASHYLKILLDGLLGQTNFRNEIIWKRTSAHNSAKRWGPIHDIILYYTKSDDYTWNNVYMPYNDKHIQNSYNKVDANGRKFATSDLTGSGLTSGESGQEWHGFNPAKSKRHWAIPATGKELFPEYKDLSTFEWLDLFAKNDLIYFAKDGSSLPRFKRYLDQAKGQKIQDIVTDIAPLSSWADERLGYPTQKPIALLERIIKASSNPEDLVLDPFCGCGTAIHAAQKLGRRWIGIDITHLAIALIKQRLTSAFGTDCQFKILKERQKMWHRSVIWLKMAISTPATNFNTGPYL